MIPKIIHQIWLGDQELRPDNLLNTWKSMNPSWEYKLWTEDNLPELYNFKKYNLLKEKYNGKSDIIRYELLYNFGGIYVDADAKALKPLTDDFINYEIFACWENERANPGMISNGYLASSPENSFIKKIINEIHSFDDVLVEHISAWRITGPRLLTNLYNLLPDTEKLKFKIFPSWYFIPTHYSGLVYDGSESPYAEQYWASTKNIYKYLKQII